MARNKFDIDEELESPFDIRHLKRALVYVKKYKTRMLVSFILSAFSAMVGLTAPKITQYALDVAIVEKDVPLLLIMAGLFFLTIIVSVILATIRSKIMTAVGQDIIYDIRKDLFSHLQRLPFQYYDDRPHGKILVRVINYVNSVSDLLSNGIINFILEIINLLFIAGFMLFTSVWLTLLVLAGVPLFLLLVGLIKTRQRRAWQAVSNKSSNLNAYLHESIVGVRITQGFVREKENAEIFDKLAMSFKNAWILAVKLSNLIGPGVDTIAMMVSVAIYLVGLLVLGPEVVSLGVLVAMTGYAARFWQPILNLSNLFNNFINNIAYLERIFETMDEKVTVDDAEGAEELPAIKGNVTFDDVTFAYDEKAVILKNVSFDIKAGESIALVGATGAGKTTVVNLISRFYNVTGGRILIDNHDIANVSLHSLRSQMGIMLQDSFIFSGTIKDNILYGKLDASMEDVEKACKTVCADEFIRELSDGYMTEVNERGSSLSQGQKQLLAFARTLLADPKILILDEATSSIDAKTERQLQTALQELLKGRTSFLIAHRLSTIKSCDKIMYIANGGVAECGSHEELLALRGLYYRLYTSQLQDLAVSKKSNPMLAANRS